MQSALDCSDMTEGRDGTEKGDKLRNTSIVGKEKSKRKFEVVMDARGS